MIGALAQLCHILITDEDAARGLVGCPEERKFLGFSISNDGSERRIAPKALEKFQMRVREFTRRTTGESLPQIVQLLRSYLIGWRSYFGFCQTPVMLTNLEAWIRRRLRMYLWRQCKNGHNRFKELRRRGVTKFQAAVAAGSPTAFWRMSRHVSVQKALRNHELALLVCPASMLPVEAQPSRTAVCGPVCTVVWEGRRRKASPYPDQYLFRDIAALTHAVAFHVTICIKTHTGLATHGMYSLH